MRGSADTISLPWTSRTEKQHQQKLLTISPPPPNPLIHPQEPDKFLKELEDIKVLEGSEVEFVAEFCKPNAKLRWFKNKLEIFHGQKYHFVNDDTEYRLVITTVKPEDGGKFTIECNGITSSAWLYVEGRFLSSV